MFRFSNRRNKHEGLPLSAPPIPSDLLGRRDLRLDRHLGLAGNAIARSQDCNTTASRQNDAYYAGREDQAYRYQQSADADRAYQDRQAYLEQQRIQRDDDRQIYPVRVTTVARDLRPISRAATGSHSPSA